MDYYRRLAESDGERSFWHGVDPERDRWIDWFFEAVRDEDGHLIPVRQLSVGVSGDRPRYSWRHLEDVEGGLAEGTLDDTLNVLERISSDRFEAEWTAE